MRALLAAVAMVGVATVADVDLATERAPTRRAVVGVDRIPELRGRPWPDAEAVVPQEFGSADRLNERVDVVGQAASPPTSKRTW